MFNLNVMCSVGFYGEMWRKTVPAQYQIQFETYRMSSDG